MMKTLVLCMALMASGLLHAQNATVTVRVDNFNSNKGTLYLALYQKDNFLKSKPTFGKALNISDGKVKAVFSDVPKGNYAVSCFQDLNGNQRLDRKDNGIPSEPYGFSNNPEFHAYPQFEQAKFNVGSKSVIKTIHMVNE